MAEITVTPEVVAAVEKAACFSCGRYPYEECPRPADKACGREFEGGDRHPEWNTVGDGTPLNMWLETKLDGEAGTNICFCRIMCIGEEPEWVSRDGRTTVTHHSFAAPTHWRWAANFHEKDPDRWRAIAKEIAEAFEQLEVAPSEWHAEKAERALGALLLEHCDTIADAMDYAANSMPGSPVAETNALRRAAETVCEFDWSDNDGDAVAAIDALRRVLAADEK